MRWLSLVLLVGCDYFLRVDHLDPLDAQPPLVDSNLMLFDAGPCVGTLVGYSGGKGLIQICVPDSPVKGDYVLGDKFDTEGVDCDQLLDQADGTRLCVIAAHTITIAQNIDFKGMRPIVLAASDSVYVHGNVFVGARLNGEQGPGSGYRDCSTSTGGDDASFNSAGGGGAGGSFATQGGKGGTAIGGSAGGTPASPATLDRIRGGCSGGDGGAGMPHSNGGGLGGKSGGAVYIVAGATIDLAATINASGAGGVGGDTSMSLIGGGGGGGGGSGGMIALDAPSIAVTGMTFLLANGGGGGSGGGNTTNSGTDPIADATHYDIRAPGGAVVTGGSAGGGGAARMTPNGQAGGSTSKSGGGGGGGNGYIVYYTSQSSEPNVSASPAPYINP